MSALMKWSLALLLGGAVGHATAAEVNAQASKTTPVDIRNFAFAPHTVTVPVGTRITWTNRDDEPHRIVSAGQQFAPSHALDTGDAYGVTFTQPGTYAYYCGIHPYMVGTIIVQ